MNQKVFRTRRFFRKQKFVKKDRIGVALELCWTSSNEEDFNWQVGGYWTQKMPAHSVQHERKGYAMGEEQKKKKKKNQKLQQKYFK